MFNEKDVDSSVPIISKRNVGTKVNFIDNNNIWWLNGSLNKKTLNLLTIQNYFILFGSVIFCWWSFLVLCFWPWTYIYFVFVLLLLIYFWFFFCFVCICFIFYFSCDLDKYDYCICYVRLNDHYQSNIMSYDIFFLFILFLVCWFALLLFKYFQCLKKNVVSISFHQKKISCFLFNL